MTVNRRYRTIEQRQAEVYTIQQIYTSNKGHIMKLRKGVEKKGVWIKRYR